MIGEELPKSIPRKAGQNIIPMTMQAISPVPPMPMEEPLPIAITVWVRYMRLSIRKGTESFSTAMKKAAGKCRLTEMEMLSDITIPSMER